MWSPEQQQESGQGSAAACPSHVEPPHTHTPDCPSPKAGSSAFLWAPPTAGLCVLRLEVEVSRSRGRLGDRLVPGRSFADPSPRGKGVEGGSSQTEVGAGVGVAPTQTCLEDGVGSFCCCHK